MILYICICTVYAMYIHLSYIYIYIYTASSFAALENCFYCFTYHFRADPLCLQLFRHPANDSHYRNVRGLVALPVPDTSSQKACFVPWIPPLDIWHGLWTQIQNLMAWCFYSPFDSNHWLFALKWNCIFLHFICVWSTLPCFWESIRLANPQAEKNSIICLIG